MITTATLLKLKPLEWKDANLESVNAIQATGINGFYLIIVNSTGFYTTGSIAELEPYEKAEMMGDPDSNAKVPAVVAEEGLFSLLLKGNAPIAKEFRRWVTRDLLLRVLLDEEPLHRSDRPIKEKLLTSGLGITLRQAFHRD